MFLCGWVKDEILKILKGMPLQRESKTLNEQPLHFSDISMELWILT